jgi:hypothetical protein
MGFVVLSKYLRIEESEEKRIAAAVEALKADPHSPREITVTLILSVHREYPKHVVTGKDDAGDDVIAVVNSAEEEAAISQPAAELELTPAVVIDSGLTPDPLDAGEAEAPAPAGVEASEAEAGVEAETAE